MTHNANLTFHCTVYYDISYNELRSSSVFNNLFFIFVEFINICGGMYLNISSDTFANLEAKRGLNPDQATDLSALHRCYILRATIPLREQQSFSTIRQKPVSFCCCG